MKLKTFPSRFHSIALLLVIAIFVFIRLIYLDFVPIWDGFMYSYGLLAAVNSPFSLYQFDVFGHSSWLFMLLLAIPQYFSPGNAVLLNLTTIILGVVGIVLFHVFARLFLQSQRVNPPGLELVLLVGLFGLHPVYLANSLNVNTDFGVLLGFIGLLYCLLSGRKKTCIFFGVFLCFTKESGILLYAITVGLFLLVFFLRLDKPFQEKIKGLLNELYLAIPGIVLMGYLLVKAVITEKSVLFEGVDSASIPELFLSFDLLNLEFLSSLINIFIMNFNWVLSFILLLVATRAVCLWIFGSAALERLNKEGLFFVLVFLSVVFFLTRFPNGANVRYFLPAYPLLFVLGYLALRKLIRTAQTRVVVLSSILVLNFSSNFFTWDPLTNHLYGTFQFGKHRLLKPLSLFAKDRTQYGIDGLVYNLQFTNMHYLLEEFYASLKVSHWTPLVSVAPHYPIPAFGFIEKQSFERVLPMKSASIPWAIKVDELLKAKEKPKELYYVEFPNFNNRYYLQSLWSDYRQKQSYEFERNGYSLSVRHLELRKG